MSRYTNRKRRRALGGVVDPAAGLARRLLFCAFFAGTLVAQAPTSESLHRALERASTANALDDVAPQIEGWARARRGDPEAANLLMALGARNAALLRNAAATAVYELVSTAYPSHRVAGAVEAARIRYLTEPFERAVAAMEAALASLPSNAEPNTAEAMAHDRGVRSLSEWYEARGAWSVAADVLERPLRHRSLCGTCDRMTEAGRDLRSARLRLRAGDALEAAFRLLRWVDVGAYAAQELFAEAALASDPAAFADRVAASPAYAWKADVLAPVAALLAARGHDAAAILAVAGADPRCPDHVACRVAARLLIRAGPPAVGELARRVRAGDLVAVAVAAQIDDDDVHAALTDVAGPSGESPAGRAARRSLEIVRARRAALRDVKPVDRIRSETHSATRPTRRG
ncbi:MAG TPA: hypothetical protein VEI02_01910 [Planctomycetota bacterium]|nr:hypothetical protein [Planctomycetota bacterium]